MPYRIASKVIISKKATSMNFVNIHAMKNVEKK